MTLGILDPASLAVVFFFWAGWALGIWAIVHASRTTDAAWGAVSGSRVAWVVGILATNFLLPTLPFLFPVALIGLVISIVYLAAVRPQLNRASTARRESTVS
ncbi:MAG: DUF2516 family protein [Acidimicrobiia bacterium]